MSKRIFLAGASGAIGRRLIPQLVQAGYHVTGMTRSAEGARDLERLGAAAALADVFDGDGLAAAIEAARPDAVLHQLTDLSLLATQPDQAAVAIARNARIREEGTRNLVAASIATGVKRLIAQSITWAYAPGPLPHAEDDALDTAAPAPRSTTINGVIALETAVLRTGGLEGSILRYGQLYGPGTMNPAPAGDSPVHVDAAARAALLALERQAVGVFNIAEPNRAVATGKAESQLGWSHAYRLSPSPLQP